MLLEILTYPHPGLRETCAPVSEITPDIRNLAQDMIETMYSARGVGLAAPQVGKKMRMFVMDAGGGETEKKPRVIINPELELGGELIVSEKEGCLSVPLGFRANVSRYSQARVRGLDLEGQPIDEQLEGLPAIIVQHETDHLDGKLFIDNLSRLRRSLYDGKIKKWLKQKNQE